MGLVLGELGELGEESGGGELGGESSVGELRGESSGGQLPCSVPMGRRRREA